MSDEGGIGKGVLGQAAERRIRGGGEQGSHTSSVVRLGIRGITALEWNSAAKEASLVEAARTMKEAIQSCGWRQLWHTARKKEKKKGGKKTQTMLDTRSEKKGKQNTFLCKHF